MCCGHVAGRFLPSGCVVRSWSHSLGAVSGPALWRCPRGSWLDRPGLPDFELGSKVLVGGRLECTQACNFEDRVCSSSVLSKGPQLLVCVACTRPLLCLLPMGNCLLAGHWALLPMGLTEQRVPNIMHRFSGTARAPVSRCACLKPGFLRSMCKLLVGTRTEVRRPQDTRWAISTRQEL
ncbi:uncharacterized protein LOC123779134 isoform X3 [Ursus americanus]|uniref:uncharacterized protein LOC123779134 isoform X3 n=1 Tax=Ursus americanus TaxID=9643 RepID=UPI001E67C99A|nr:uncharacterized protein LOC123779134 isoform X3 [Ursus americanus]